MAKHLQKCDLIAKPPHAPSRHAPLVPVLTALIARTAPGDGTSLGLLSRLELLALEVAGFWPTPGPWWRIKESHKRCYNYDNQKAN